MPGEGRDCPNSPANRKPCALREFLRDLRGTGGQAGGAALHEGAGAVGGGRGVAPAAAGEALVEEVKRKLREALRRYSQE
jgi:hypothetical protein